MRRVVVEEDELLHPASHRQVHGVLHRAVSPAAPGGILAVGILRVVNEQVDAGDEREMPLLAGMHEAMRLPARRVLPPEGLVVGDVRDADLAGVQAIAEGRRGVVDHLRGRAIGPHAEPLLPQLLEGDLRAQLVELDGKVRVLHLPRERALQRAIDAARAVDAEPAAGDVGGEEERKALNVVPMGVADEDVHRRQGRPAGEEVETQGAGAGAAIEEDDGPVVGAHLHAARVAAVERRAPPRSRNGAAGAPEADQHRG